MCQKIWQTRDLKGSVAEIGVSGGATTIFLNKYMRSIGLNKKYYALDTFSGFTKEDISFEVEHRKKSKKLFSTGFDVNKKKWFDWTMKHNNLGEVEVIEADVNEFDLGMLKQLSFCLLDVDLYRPMKKALPELYDSLVPGGVIIVDDCDDGNIRWDGADQAYKEFVHEAQLEPNIVHGKLGVIEKPVII